MAQEIRAVIFDMDGLLLDSEPIYERVWTDSTAAFGLNLTHDKFVQLLGRGRKGALEKLKDFFGDTIPLDALNAEVSLREARYFQETTLAPKKGALGLLDYLETKEIAKAVATSNRGVIAEERLTRAGLRERFPVVITVDMVSKGKPAPDLFLKAAEALECEPSTCVVLEDSEQGIRAADAAGMRGVLVPDLLPPTAELRALAHAVHEDLDRVRAWIAEVQ